MREIKNNLLWVDTSESLTHNCFSIVATHILYETAYFLERMNNSTAHIFSYPIGFCHQSQKHYQADIHFDECFKITG